MEWAVIKMLKYLISWGKIFDGAIEVLSFGMLTSNITLYIAKKYSSKKFYKEMKI